MAQRSFSLQLQRLIAREMKLGKYASEEQLLKQALAALADQRGAVAGIQSGLDDVAAGRFRSRRAFSKFMLKRHPVDVGE